MSTEKLGANKSYREFDIVSACKAQLIAGREQFSPVFRLKPTN